MNRRYELQAVLEGILGSGNVYFQPPENLKMRYDCIVYERSESKLSMRTTPLIACWTATR